MFFALCRCELFIPEARSLKAKRAVLNRLKQRVRGRFHAAVAEVATQDLWQRGTLGMALVGLHPGHLEDGLAAMRRLIEQEERCQIAAWETRVEAFGDPACGEREDAAAREDRPWDEPEEDDELYGPLWGGQGPGPDRGR